MPSQIRVAGNLYFVYVRHNWGTEKLIVNVKKRSVALARAEAKMRAVRIGWTCPEVIDVIPAKYVAGKLVATRRMRKQTGKTVANRKPRSHRSVRSTRRVAMA